MRNNKTILAYTVPNMRGYYSSFFNIVLPMANYIESQGGSVFQIYKEIYKDRYEIGDTSIVYRFTILFKFSSDAEFPFDAVDAHLRYIS